MVDWRRFSLGATIAVLLLSSVISAPVKNKDAEFILPTIDLNGLVGHPYNLTCQLTEEYIARTGFDAWNITIELDAECSNLTTISRVLDHRTAQMELPPLPFMECLHGFAHCTVNGEDLATEHFLIGYLPFPVNETRVENRNWEDLLIYFSTTGVNTHYATRYSLGFEAFHKPFYDCKSTGPLEHVCEVKYFEVAFFEEGPVHFRINGSNPGGTYKSDLYTVDFQHVVKLSQVLNPEVEALSPFEIIVCFLPPVPPDLCQHVCPPDLHYQVNISNKFHHVSKVISSQDIDPLTGGHCVNVSSLYPATLYSLTIQAIVPGSIYDSDVLRAKFSTTQTVPQKHPEVTFGAYEVKLSKPNVRDVTVYWKGLEEIFHGGDMLSYELSQVCGTHLIKAETSDTHYDFKNLLNDQDCSIFIRAENLHGFHQDSDNLISGIRIARQDLLLPEVHNLTALIQWNASMIHVSWDYPYSGNDVEGFTVFYCRGVLYCMDTIEWLLVSKDAHQAMVTLPTPWTLEEPYMVGMSALGPDGRSSGIRWTECFHSAVQRPQRPRFNLFSIGKRSIQLEAISPPCNKAKAIEGYTYGYSIEFCSSDGESCKGKIISLVVFRKHAGIIIIEGLSPAQEYLIWGRSLSINGPSYYNSSILQVKTLPERLTGGVIAGIAVAGAFGLLFLVCGVYTCCRQSGKVWKLFKKKLTLDIRLPSNSNMEQNYAAPRTLEGMEDVNMRDFPTNTPQPPDVLEERRFLVIAGGNDNDEPDDQETNTSLPRPPNPFISEDFEYAASERQFILPQPQERPILPEIGPVLPPLSSQYTPDDETIQPNPSPVPQEPEWGEPILPSLASLQAHTDLAAPHPEEPSSHPSDSGGSSCYIGKGAHVSPKLSNPPAGEPANVDLFSFSDSDQIELYTKQSLHEEKPKESTGDSSGSSCYVGRGAHVVHAGEVPTGEPATLRDDIVDDDSGGIPDTTSSSHQDSSGSYTYVGVGVPSYHFGEPPEGEAEDVEEEEENNEEEEEEGLLNEEIPSLSHMTRGDNNTTESVSAFSNPTNSGSSAFQVLPQFDHHRTVLPKI